MSVLVGRISFALVSDAVAGCHRRARVTDAARARAELGVDRVHALGLLPPHLDLFARAQAGRGGAALPDPTK